MAGFARLCPGDVFEVTVRHGTQKWKTKGRIEKTGNQKWDTPEFTFKAVVGDIFTIKVYRKLIYVGICNRSRLGFRLKKKFNFSWSNATEEDNFLFFQQWTV